jgi:hypothetical protein
MPRRPNYHGERIERDRAKAQKRTARAEAKAAKTAARKEVKPQSEEDGDATSKA